MSFLLSYQASSTDLWLKNYDSITQLHGSQMGGGSQTFYTSREQQVPDWITQALVYTINDTISFEEQQIISSMDPQ